MPRHINIISVRVTAEEEAAMRAGAAALDLGLSALVELAGLNAAHTLGFFEDRGSSPVLRGGIWDALPDRGEETTASKLNVSLSQTAVELARRAAEWLGTSTPLFLVGATLRYVGNRQRLEGRANPALTKVILPEQYRRRS
jgi:uncharacterized protein (DUF1778 family)